MSEHGSQLVLILTTRDAQSATELGAASGQSPADTARPLQQLMDRGFLVAHAE